jgi:hypothetical protein
MLPHARWLGVLVWCACQRQDFADLQAIVDAGRGDVPLHGLRQPEDRLGGDVPERGAGHAVALTVQSPPTSPRRNSFLLRLIRPRKTDRLKFPDFAFLFQNVQEIPSLCMLPPSLDGIVTV